MLEKRPQWRIRQCGKTWTTSCVRPTKPTPILISTTTSMSHHLQVTRRVKVSLLTADWFLNRIWCPPFVHQSQVYIKMLEKRPQWRIRQCGKTWTTSCVRPWKPTPIPISTTTSTSHHLQVTRRVKVSPLTADWFLNRIWCLPSFQRMWKSAMWKDLDNIMCQAN